MFSKLKCLLAIQLLLCDQVFSRAPPQAPGSNIHEVEKKVSGPRPEVFKQLYLNSAERHPDKEHSRVQSAERFVSVLRGKLQSQVEEGQHFGGRCEELLAASRMDDALSSVFPRELLGLSVVPALVMGGCTDEAHTLMLNLYDVLGVNDTEELLLDLEDLIQKRMKRRPTTTPTEDEPNIEAVMVNIQLLAEVRPGAQKMEEHCERWVQVNGSTLSGTAMEGSLGDLYHALDSCGKLGVLCAGVTSGSSPGRYHAVLNKGSHIQLSASSECWIHQCSADQDAPTTPGLRLKRSICINRKEERVYRVMEWIPGVSTLYNLGTAVYYASVNCTETAKERAILSAVDLGTDALVVATGGTAGLAGYALGAGVKTGVKAGVKYLINTMKHHDDVLVNQFSPEGGVFTVP
ncbi:uncharacterized protein apof [Synchiropus splendidus]|uniref:uncharacterized protein apof n=1 Tax=Synchiropus splendidus TaxID=270530 RepID=UPI00237DB0E2|nr:uncharacterized protein apof [Synchiropus splendidus]